MIHKRKYDIRPRFLKKNVFPANHFDPSLFFRQVQPGAMHLSLNLLFTKSCIVSFQCEEFLEINKDYRAMRLTRF